MTVLLTLASGVSVKEYGTLVNVPVWVKLILPLPQSLAEPRLAYPSASGSPFGLVLGESSGMTKPYVDTASYPVSLVRKVG